MSSYFNLFVITNCVSVICLIMLTPFFILCFWCLYIPAIHGFFCFCFSFWLVETSSEKSASNPVSNNKSCPSVLRWISQLGFISASKMIKKVVFYESFLSFSQPFDFWGKKCKHLELYLWLISLQKYNLTGKSFAWRSYIFYMFSILILPSSFPGLFMLLTFFASG